MTDLNLKTVPVIREARHGEEAGYLFSFGAYGDTHVAVIGGSMDDGLESCLDWIDDNVPGLLYTIGEDDYVDAARDLEVAWPSDDPDTIDKVTQEAETDMTMVSHTTLKNGNCIPSYEWHVRELKASELASLMQRFCQSCESELDCAKECILCGECEAGLVANVAHDLRIERGPVQPEPNTKDIAEREDRDDPDAYDVRLQVRDWHGIDWALRVGGSSYDQDHRGFWGAGRLSPYDTDACVRETAQDLVSQATRAGCHVGGVVITPHCDMSADCSRTVTHLDNRGYVYCERCALRRKSGGTPTRKLRPAELKKLVVGEPISYSRKG